MTNRRQTNQGLKIIENATIDEVIELLQDLDVNDDVIDKVTSMKTKVGRVTTTRKKDSTKERKRPVIAYEKQCTAMLKNNDKLKCQVAMCDKTLQRCWAHMTKEEKAEYKAKKPAKKNK